MHDFQLYELRLHSQKQLPLLWIDYNTGFGMNNKKSFTTKWGKEQTVSVPIFIK